MGKKIVDKKNGSKTVIDRGKIITNFGGAGQKPPTAAHNNVTDENNMEEYCNRTSVQDVYEKFHMLSDDDNQNVREGNDNFSDGLDTATIVTLWSVSRNQPVTDRVNIYARATEHLDDKTRCELFTQLLLDENSAHLPYQDNIIVFDHDFSELYHLKTYNSMLLDVKTLEMFAMFDGKRWSLLKEFVLLDKRLSSEILYQAAQQEELSVREIKSLTVNPNSTNEMFVYLLDNVKNADERSMLIYTLVKREDAHNFSEEVLISLANHYDSERVTTMIKEHKNFSLHTVTILAKSPEPFVRKIAAESVKASGEILQTLAEDINIGVQSRVARNPNTLPRTLSYLVQPDKRVTFSNQRYVSNLVRWRVAENPHTPKETLTMLCDDPIHNVRLAAQKTLEKI